METAGDWCPRVVLDERDDAWMSRFRMGMRSTRMINASQSRISWRNGPLSEGWAKILNGCAAVAPNWIG